jgi:N-sulfoglucosamine sulfohydrolase
MSAIRYLTCCLLGWLVGAAMIPEELTAADEARRPNVLVVVSDDQSWPHCGAYGDDLAHTAAFDRIAREGVLFTHAFWPTTKPGRASRTS